ncbi:molybdopterin-guanine dinucleotide biosynthesis protein B [Endozoicomonas numazuensis]|uniref:Molybdopterin-guanine dinucleotide biosynthesis protein B n=1 Tax=Endozoicomonas numazuensis TaxID=1137799 RepID=A0A081NEV4_9GAMM|nr:molybdopterin-guanine dinucleotide biosynthesis protein B [Endozoicomonas numazuensis]KEQ16977.1 molybdopterin-guanine dinucleotide biosynthesis protein B [Endozoicomonas numazuensis]
MPPLSLQSFPLPVIGLAAFSGTGKTTLLEKLIPLLSAKELNIGVVKASHHSVDPDTPGKDSHRLRLAGSSQLVLSTPERSICYTERADRSDPQLMNELQLLDCNRLDLIIIEGFRDVAFPKIELHRQDLGRSLLYPSDPNIIAIAWDKPLNDNPGLPQLNLNNPDQIAEFIYSFWVKNSFKETSQ